MRCVLFVLLSCLGSAALAGAQVVDPSGHWEGSVQLPAMEIAVQVDFQRAPDGTVAGTISVPAQHLTGLPLTTITFDGRDMTFGARSDQVLSGVLSEDRQSISGDFRMEGVTAAFTLTRTGEARIAPPPKSAALRPDFVGQWTGTLEADGGLRLVLTLANAPDGSSRGQIVNLDEGGLTIPIMIATDGRRITLTSPAAPGAFAGTLGPDGQAIAGSYTENGQEIPLTFTRAR